MPRSRRYRTDAIDWPLLHWLLRSPLLRAQDLAVFTGLSRSTASRRLEELEQWGLIEWIAPACITRHGAERLWHLSNAGIHLLAAALKIDAAELAKTWATDERRLLNLLPRVPQLVRVQSVVGDILAGATRALAEQGREAGGVWHWVRDYSHRFTYRDRPQRLRVDAAVALHVTRIRARGATGATSDGARWERRDRWHVAFIVGDARVQDWDAAERVLDSLLAYRESPERWQVYSAFPPVLILAEHERHAERWRWLAREVAQGRRAPPLAGAVAVIPGPPQSSERDPFDAWRLPWISLDTGVMMRLTSLLSALPRVAIPPGVDGRGAPTPAVAGKTVVVALNRGPRIIAGGFQGRAEAQAARSESTDADVESVRDSDDLRLLSLRLGARHVETLDLLLQAPGSHVRDLAALLGLKLGSMDRYLSALDRYSLLQSIAPNALPSSGERDKWASPSSSKRADSGHLSYDPVSSMRLSASGHRLVTMIQGIGARSRFAQRAAPPRTPNRVAVAGVDESTYRQAGHDAGVFHFMALLARPAPEEHQCTTYRLVWWETGALAERRYRYQGSWHNLRPDGEGLFQAGQTRFRFWLEWDRGSMNLSNLIRKFATYGVYLASGEWREAPGRIIPHLLVVVPGMGQLERMRRAAAIAAAEYPFLAGGSSAGHGARLSASITLAGRLEEAGPLAPIWWPLCPVPQPPVEHGSAAERRPTLQQIFPAHAVSRRSA